MVTERRPPSSAPACTSLGGPVRRTTSHSLISSATPAAAGGRPPAPACAGAGSPPAHWPSALTRSAAVMGAGPGAAGARILAKLDVLGMRRLGLDRIPSAQPPKPGAAAQTITTP